MTTARTTRNHPAVDALPVMSAANLIRYVEREVTYLSTEDQRRIPLPLAAAINEVLIRYQRASTSLGCYPRDDAEDVKDPQPEGATPDEGTMWPLSGLVRPRRMRDTRL